MRKLYIYISIIIGISMIISFSSCEKDTHKKKVKYYITNSIDGFDVSYRNENGELIKKTIITQSEEDIWTYSFDGDRGDIVYLMVEDTVATSFVYARVLVDGKVYKEGVRTEDNTKPLVVSGTIPY